LTIKHLTYRIAHTSALGIASLAQAMGLSAQTLTNSLNVNSETHNLNIARFEMLVDFANGNFKAAEYFAQKENAVVVQLPAALDLGDMNLLDAYMKCVEGQGEIAYSFRKAWADGRISAQEFTEIKAETIRNIGYQLAFLAAIEAITR
jgi:hypothetical protein